MARKTRRVNRKRRNTRRLRRGGGNKTDACAKYRLEGTKPSIPAPIQTNSISDESYVALLAALRSVPEEKILLLKVGSNDSSVAQQALTNIAGSGGSKGKNGSLFIEFPYNLKDVDTSLIKLDNPAMTRLLSSAIPRSLINDINENKIHLLAISPVKAKNYNDFSYPFHEEPDTDSVKGGLLSIIYHKIDTRNYIETFFPLAPGSDKTNEILDLIVSRKMPVILFNAMGSYCYRSFKYINDMRKNAGYITIYMGLVDEEPFSQCDIGRTIYPDPETSCAK
jgi:hypothetical protein